MKHNIRPFHRLRHTNNCKPSNCPPPKNNTVSDSYITITINEQNADRYYLEDGKPNPDCYIQAAMYLSIVIGVDRQIETAEQMTNYDEMLLRIRTLYNMAIGYRMECYKRLLQH